MKKIVVITLAIIMLLSLNGSAAEIETTEAPTEEVTEAQTEIQTEAATEDPTEAEAVETVEVVEDAVESPAKIENHTEAPTAETYIGYDPDQDMGIGMYNPYMYCAVAPVNNHKFGFGYIDEGYYLFDEMGHCWAIDNPDLHSGEVTICYDTRGTEDITDDVLVLIMVDCPIIIEAIRSAAGI